jgi:hypothetical protein
MAPMVSLQVVQVTLFSWNKNMSEKVLSLIKIGELNETRTNEAERKFGISILFV